jgi:hypothetical protein
MRAAKYFLLLLAALPLSATAAPRGDEASARAAILVRFDAALRGDTPALKKILGDDLDYCNFRGECESKRQYIGEIASGQLKYRSIEHTVERVKLFADTAVVTGRVQATATRDGVERSINAYFMAVLAWRDNRWQFSSWSSTLIEPPPPK